MNVDQLEEFEGLDADAVRAYLERKRWLRRGLHWHAPDSAADLYDSEIDSDLVTNTGLVTIAKSEGRSVQALLREIAPRVRKGIPSEAAREAHRGPWLGRSMGSRGVGFNLMIGVWEGLEFVRANQKAGHPEEWSFWPLDEYGQRVPWPKDANGRPL